MFSVRTSFDATLSDISRRHRAFADDHESTVPQSALAPRHPALTVETKLDGERFILHVSRDGVVKAQSRRAVWYRYELEPAALCEWALCPNSFSRRARPTFIHSDIYSPVLGPAVRKAVGHLNMDIILDGEGKHSFTLAFLL